MTHRPVSFLLIIVLAIFAAPVAAAQKSTLPAKKRLTAPGEFSLAIEESGWGKASAADLRAVLKSSCEQLMRHFPRRVLEPVRVRHSKSGPITLFQRTLRGEIVVELSSKDLYWCQHAFQMAHEFCHVLCEFKNADRSNMWFEESLCELASLYALRSMARTWKTNPPYPNWRSYGAALQDYADERIGNQQVPQGKTFSQWFRESEKAMRSKPTLREKNGIVAVQLLPLFEADPQHWAAVTYLNRGRTSKKTTFREFMANWYRHSPAKHRPFIKKVAATFGI